jgi:hypothetical protein
VQCTSELTWIELCTLGGGGGGGRGGGRGRGAPAGRGGRGGTLSMLSLDLMRVV